MPSDRDTLLSFGFEAARVDWALKATAGRGLQPAMDHIIENQEKPIPDVGSQAPGTSADKPSGGDEDEDEDMKAAIALSQSQDGAEAKSIKCSECGKVFRNTAMAEFHAEKSGHDQFEESTDEIKPLTEEEKQQRLAELRGKMAEKRAKKSAAEAEENKANEAIRRKAGKDSTQIKADLQAKEAMKEAEQRRRDKIADAKARADIKAQIEADKKARAEKAAREKALREGREVPQPDAAASTSAAPAPAASTSTGAKKEYTETRLQIRLSGGGVYTTTLPVGGTLRDVAEFLAAQTLQVDTETVQFATTFPRKQYTRAEWSKTLQELGLTPSAVLIAS